MATPPGLRVPRLRCPGAPGGPFQAAQWREDLACTQSSARRDQDPPGEWPTGEGSQDKSSKRQLSRQSWEPPELAGSKPGKRREEKLLWTTRWTTGQGCSGTSCCCFCWGRGLNPRRGTCPLGPAWVTCLLEIILSSAVLLGGEVMPCWAGEMCSQGLHHTPQARPGGPALLRGAQLRVVPRSSPACRSGSVTERTQTCSSFQRKPDLVETQGPPAPWSPLAPRQGCPPSIVWGPGVHRLLPGRWGRHTSGSLPSGAPLPLQGTGSQGALEITAGASPLLTRLGAAGVPSKSFFPS